MTNQLPSYSSVQTMDVIQTILNPSLPLSSLSYTVNNYAEFVKVATAAGHLRTSLGFSWDDPAVDFNEVDIELFPNGWAYRHAHIFLEVNSPHSTL